MDINEMVGLMTKKNPKQMIRVLLSNMEPSRKRDVLQKSLDFLEAEEAKHNAAMEELEGYMQLFSAALTSGDKELIAQRIRETTESFDNLLHVKATSYQTSKDMMNKFMTDLDAVRGREKDEKE
jgi:hypothetical protein